MSIELLAIILGFLATVTKALLDMRRLRSEVATLQLGLNSVYAQVSNHIPTDLASIRQSLSSLPCVQPKGCPGEK